MTDPKLIQFTADIVASHVEHNRVAVGDVSAMISSVYASLSGLTARPETSEPLVPAVPVRSSVRPDSLTCLECGAIQKTLKRHIENAHKLTPDQYRAKWKLRADYPMVAPNNSAERSRASKARGFGRKPGATVPAKSG